MADLFIGTPVPVLTTGAFQDPGNRYSSKKLFKNGSTRYSVGNGSLTSIVKNTGSWSGVLGTAPTGFASGQQSIFDAAAGKIHFLGRKSASPSHLFYYNFDLGSETYSTPVDSGEPNTTVVGALKSNGDIYAVFNSAVGYGDPLKIGIVSGGAWGAITTLIAGAPDIFPLGTGIVVDGSDNAKIVYQLQYRAPTYTAHSDFYFVAFDSGVAGTPGLIESSVGLNNYTCGPGLIYNDQILFPNYSLNTTSPHHIYLWVGDIVASPTWSKVDVATLVGSNSSDFSPDLVLVNGAEPWILWVDNKFSVPYTAQINAAKWNGSTMDATYTAWDTYGNPPPASGGLGNGDRDISGVSCIITSGFSAELIGYTEFNNSFDETYCFLAGTFPGGTPPVSRGPRNRFY